MIVPAPVARSIARGDAWIIHRPITSRTHYRLATPIKIHDDTWIEITRRRRAPLGTLTPMEALEAGYQTPEHFQNTWVRLHDRDWVRRQETYLEQVGETDPDYIDALINLRYQNHWRQQLAWYLTVRPVDMPRLLAAASDELYVHTPARALPEEPEALTEQQHRDHIQQSSRHRSAKLHAALAQDRALLDREQRIRNVMDAARRRGITNVIAPEVNTLKRMIRHGRSEQAIVLTLERLEDRVRPEAA